KLWPAARFGIGPTIENGFYYDVDIEGVKLTPEDLPKIEAEMARIAKANAPFERAEHPIDEAVALFKGMGQKFKLEIIEALRATGARTVSTYKEGDFIDLCKGPHVSKAGEIGAFKLLSVAGAYWR